MKTPNTLTKVRYFSFIFIYLAFSAPLTGWCATDLKAIKKQLDALIQPQIEADQNVGIVVGVLKEGKGDIFYYGKTALSSNKAPSKSTIYEIGSITKVFTGLLLAQLELDGKVQLTQTLEQFIPELKGKDAGKITLRQLVTHTSGLGFRPVNLEIKDYNNPYAQYSEKDLIKGLVEYQEQPGTLGVFQYSSWGHGVLGYVLGKISKKPYEELLKEKIITPLKLKDTTITLSSSQKSRAAQGYDEFLNEVGLRDHLIFQAPGALKSTPEDLFEFIKFQLSTKNKKSIDKASLQAQQALEKAEDRDIAYGWFIDQKSGSPVLWHDGSTNGYLSFLHVDKTNDTAYFMLTNTANTPLCIKEAIYGMSCELPQTHKHDPKVMNEFEGTYRLDSSGERTLSVEARKGFLIVRPSDEWARRYNAIAEDTFYLKEWGNVYKLEFQRNKDDKHVIAVIFEKNGERKRAPKER